MGTRRNGGGSGADFGASRHVGAGRERVLFHDAALAWEVLGARDVGLQRAWLFKVLKNKATSQWKADVRVIVCVDLARYELMAAVGSDVFFAEDPEVRDHQGKEAAS